MAVNNELRKIHNQSYSQRTGLFFKLKSKSEPPEQEHPAMISLKEYAVHAPRGLAHFETDISKCKIIAML